MIFIYSISLGITVLPTLSEYRPSAAGLTTCPGWHFNVKLAIL